MSKKIKYGIKLQIAVDDYIWVTEDNGKCSMFEIRPKLYRTFEEAQDAAKTWKRFARVEPFEEKI